MTRPAYTPKAVNRLHSAGLPDVLREPLTESWETFVQISREAQFPVPVNPDFTTSLLRVWACSDFVAQTCVNDPEVFYRLLASGDLLADYARGEHRRKLKRALKGVADATALGCVLRDFRRQEMLRIAWRDLAGWAPLNEVLFDLSALADACVDISLAHLGD